MMRTKRVFGPSSSGNEVDNREFLSYWKLVCVSGKKDQSVSDEDEQVHSILFVLIVRCLLEAPVRLEKWKSEFSWADIGRMHFRRDKVGLFVS